MGREGRMRRELREIREGGGAYEEGEAIPIHIYIYIYIRSRASLSLPTLPTYLPGCQRLRSGH